MQDDKIPQLCSPKSMASYHISKYIDFRNIQPLNKRICLAMEATKTTFFQVVGECHNTELITLFDWLHHLL